MVTRVDIRQTMHAFFQSCRMKSSLLHLNASVFCNFLPSIADSHPSGKLRQYSCLPFNT